MSCRAHSPSPFPCITSPNHECERGDASPAMARAQNRAYDVKTISTARTSPETCAESRAFPLCRSHRNLTLGKNQGGPTEHVSQVPWMRARWVPAIMEAQARMLTCLGWICLFASVMDCPCSRLPFGAPARDFSNPGGITSTSRSLRLRLCRVHGAHIHVHVI
jgi:hypothetical protein